MSHVSKKLPVVLLPKTPGLQLENIAVATQTILLSVVKTSKSAACPLCGQQTMRLHRHYQRPMINLPWGGRAVRLNLRVRRFC
jgi:transposase